MEQHIPWARFFLVVKSMCGFPVVDVRINVRVDVRINVRVDVRIDVRSMCASMCMSMCASMCPRRVRLRSSQNKAVGEGFVVEP